MMTDDSPPQELIEELEALADSWFDRETNTDKDPEPIPEVTRRRQELRALIAEYRGASDE